MRRLEVLAAWGGLLLIALLCWMWIVPMARDMYGPMNGPSAWMMTTVWDVPHLLMLWAMWAVMMAAMMLPSAAPLLMLYQGALRRRSPSTAMALPLYAMAGGYLLVWVGFSVGAVVLQRLLTQTLLLTPMMQMSGRSAIGATMLIAGLYQLTPWKRACLSRCRSPLAFVMERWRNGLAGALTMGLEHGAWCLGCCWALMLLLFAGGVMNLTIIVGLTAMVLIEKLTPLGVQTGRAMGSALIAGGVWMLVT
jgi:predicted metal-binding membrane protein